MKVTRKTLVAVIKSLDGEYRAFVKDPYGTRYYYRSYRNRIPKCVLDMAKTPSIRSITVNDKVVSSLHGSIAPF